MRLRTGAIVNPEPAVAAAVVVVVVAAAVVVVVAAAAAVVVAAVAGASSGARAVPSGSAVAVVGQETEAGLVAAAELIQDLVKICSVQQISG